MKNIVLFGFMGTGKSVVGEKVARALGMKYVDMDEIIEEKEGRTISDIFANDGEEYFRQVESETAVELARKDGLVISTGGGVVLNNENVKTLERTGIGICLNADAKVVYDRVKDESHRPLLEVENSKEKIEELLELRAPFYARVSHHIDTSNLSVDEVIQAVMDIVREDAQA